MKWIERLVVAGALLVMVPACSAIVDPDGDRLGGGSFDGGGRDAFVPDGSRPDGGMRDASRPDGDMRDGAVPDSAMPTCSPPGRTETVDCGMCGRMERTCSAGGTWVDGPCTDEGVCLPGTTMPLTCGTASVPIACTASCDWEEGVVCPLDVMILVDVTGSHNNIVATNRTRIVTDLVRPLLGAGDVRVGVAYFADFPVSPYGRDGDVPFGGLLVPTSDVDAVARALEALPRYNGGDYPESAVEAFHVLGGGPPHRLSMPFTCPSPTGGGCWRADAERAIVILTDVSQHNMPSPATAGLLSPYDGSLGAPDWDAAQPLLHGGRITLFGTVRQRDEGGIDGLRQLRQLVNLIDLGQDADRSIRPWIGDMPDLSGPLGEVADEIRGFYGL